jgi:hypothetical protein
MKHLQNHAKHNEVALPAVFDFYHVFFDRRQSVLKGSALFGLPGASINPGKRGLINQLKCGYTIQI